MTLQVKDFKDVVHAELLLLLLLLLLLYLFFFDKFNFQPQFLI